MAAYDCGLWSLTELRVLMGKKQECDGRKKAGASGESLQLRKGWALRYGAAVVGGFAAI